MTRPFGDNVFCPHCRRWHTAETAFERWMREHKELKSESGIVRFDLDVLLHRYMTATDKKGSRDLQLLMAIEVKTHDGEMRPSQRDTLSMLNEVIRNRKTNVHQERQGRHAKQHTPACRVFSHHLKRDVDLRMYGMHVLQLSGNDPTDSHQMKWQGSKRWYYITQIQLVQLLRFELDPDTLGAPDWRRRYSSFTEPTLWTLAEAI